MRVVSAAVALLVVLLGPSVTSHRPEPGERAPPAAGEAATNPFGVSTSGEAAGQYAAFLPKLAQAGVRSVRMVGEWGAIEPREGTFDFGYDDRRVGAVRRQGMEVTGILQYSARWALPPGVTNSKTFPMAKLDAFGRYVGKVVTQYRDSIRYWEVWNEPNAAAFNAGKHSAADYAKLVGAAYAAAKRVHPSAQIGITCANYDLPYLRLVIQALATQGSPDAFDFVAVHPYELLGAVATDGGEMQFLSIVSNLRKMLGEVAPKRRGVPIRFTEIGAREKLPGTEEGHDLNVVAQLLVKAYTMGIAQGVAQLQWFEAKDAGGSRGFGLLSEDMQERPAFKAYRALTDALGESPVYRGWLPLGEGGIGYGFVFDTDGEDVLVAWMPKGKTSSVRFDHSLFAIDIYTQRGRELAPQSPLTLTEKPVLLVGLTGSVLRTASANRALPYPWASPPVNSKLASITLGPRNVERGLVQVGRSATVPVALGDGTTGVRVNVGKGNALRIAVNPAFADYGTHEVYVRVTARTTEPVKRGVNAGMNIWYQSTSGSPKSSPPPYPYTNARMWWTVEPDQRWHTKVWRLTDAMFVNTFGFSLYLQFDTSPTFVVGKVEISKVPFD